jgi:hypothetical protein
LCFDTDAGKRVDAGGNALVAVGEALKKEGFDEVYYVRPPKEYKDWNKMLVQTSPKLINVYIQQYRQLYTNSTSLEFKLKGLGLKS